MLDNKRKKENNMNKVYSVNTAILLIYTECRKSSACLNEQVESLSNIPMRLPSESSNYWSGGSDPVLSDDGLVQKWYSVVHDGYQYVMVDSTNKPDHQYCSTYYPVYLKGTHPLFESLTESAQSFVACRRDYFQPCSVSYEIKIRRCGTELQYYLSPTQSYNAFCFQAGEKVSTDDIKTTTLEQTTNTDSPAYTTDQITTMMSSEQGTSIRSREQTTVQQTTITDMPIYTTYPTITKMSSVQTSSEPTTITAGNGRTDTVRTSTTQASSKKSIQTSKLLSRTTLTYYETSVASISKSTQVPWGQTKQTIQSTRRHSPTTNHETRYTLPLITEERQTSSRETSEPGATDINTMKPSTKKEFSSHHATAFKHHDATGGINVGTTVQQRLFVCLFVCMGFYADFNISVQQQVEEAVVDDTRKIIIILTVCMGLLVLTIIGLVVVIICRKRKASRKRIEENKVHEEADHKYDTPANIYQTVAERGSVANPYESLRDENVLELEMSRSEYDVLTPDENYQTLDYDRKPIEDEHCYQTLPE